MTQNEFAALMKHMDEDKADRDRQWKLTLREFRLNHRAYEDGIALCAQLVVRVDEMFERHAKAIDDMREDIRANTRATLSVIDRMDRLDGGASAA